MTSARTGAGALIGCAGSAPPRVLPAKSEFEKQYLHAECPVRFIGDFVALATDKYDLKQRPDTFVLKSHHAGITSDELEIPIIKISI